MVCDPRGLGTAVATGARGPSAGYHMERGTEYEAVKAEVSSDTHTHTHTVPLSFPLTSVPLVAESLVTVLCVCVRVCVCVCVYIQAHMSQLLGVTYDRILEQCGQILRDCDMPYQVCACVCVRARVVWGGHVCSTSGAINSVRHALASNQCLNTIPCDVAYGVCINCSLACVCVCVCLQIHLPRLLSPRSASVIGETLLAEAERLQARCLVIASHGPGERTHTHTHAYSDAHVAV